MPAGQAFNIGLGISKLHHCTAVASWTLQHPSALQLQERLRSALHRESSFASVGSGRGEGSNRGGGTRTQSLHPRHGRLQEVLSGVAEGDAALLVGGDLSILVIEVGSCKIP